MKKVINKIVSLIGPALLAILGFSCSEPLNPDPESPSDPLFPSNPGSMICAYGVLTCEFKMDISVADETGRPIEGIKVIRSMGNDTLTTDKLGNVRRTYKLPIAPSYVKVYFEDVDGDMNRGTFVKDSALFYSIKTWDGKEKPDYSKRYGEWSITGKKVLKRK